MRYPLILALGLVLGAAPAWSGPQRYVVSPELGNSTMSAVFDAPLGERINAISSAVTCELLIDKEAGTADGICAVPLTTIVVDSEPTKTEHFYDWATNKKTPAHTCTLALRIVGAKAKGPIVASAPTAFDYDGTLSVCGKTHVDGAKERITGQVILIPPASAEASEKIKIRARIEGFNREKYELGPQWTGGWLAKVQQLANVVAAEGQIDLSLFAKREASAPQP